MYKLIPFVIGVLLVAAVVSRKVAKHIWTLFFLAAAGGLVWLFW